MSSKTDELTRRAVVAGVAATGVASAVGCEPRAKAPPRERTTPMSTSKMPVIYLPHGGGPWPWVPSMAEGHGALRRHLEALPATLPAAPKAIVCVTAHWEASRPTVSTAPSPAMLYDYSGFPPDTYEVTWGAPGAPTLARRVRTLLDGAGIDSDEDAERGFDHGTFVPLSVAWPDASVPVVQMSLVKGLDPSLHLRVGQALAPLRDEGVLLVGSGMSYHNMRGFRSGRGAADARAFDEWLLEAIVSPAERAARLRRWSDAPGGRASHPREEHLLPLMVVTGAAGDDPATIPFRGEVLGARVSTVRYG